MTWEDYQVSDTGKSFNGLNFLVLNSTDMLPEAMKFGTVKNPTDTQPSQITPAICQKAL